MAVPYQRPGVTVREVTNPTVAPIPGEATSVCIVGPARGFQEYTETFVMEDKAPITLGAKYADLTTLNVLNAADLTQEAFRPSITGVENNDFDIDQSTYEADGTIRLSRAMQTTIPNNEQVTVYFENSASPSQGTSETSMVVLKGTDPKNPDGRSSSTESDSVVVQSPGAVPEGDVTIAGAGTPTVTIVRDAAATLVQEFQTVFVTHRIATSAVYTVQIDGAADGGTFTLGFTLGETQAFTAALNHNATANAVRDAIDDAIDELLGLTDEGGHCTVTFDTDTWTITIQGEHMAGTNFDAVSSSNSLTEDTDPSQAEIVIAQTITGALGPIITGTPVQLNALTTVPLPANSVEHSVLTQSGASADVQAVTYTKGTTTDADYIVTGEGTNLAIARSKGSTGMSPSTNRITVRVSYRATPPEYWLPARVFSTIDVVDRYGPALSQDGEIISPVSYAASLAFAEGAPNLVIQPLFKQVGAVKSAPTGSQEDWQATMQSLRAAEGVNVIVPLVSAGEVDTSDGLVSQALSAVRNHVKFMRENTQRYLSIVCGTDSTRRANDGTPQGSSKARKALSESIRTTDEDEHHTIISPAAFRASSPIDGREMVVGGQYAAAMVAGMMSSRAVQVPLTRRNATSMFGVAEIMTEMDKDAEADAGLTVLHDVRGVLQVRHAITTANRSVASRELNVVRAKFFHISAMRQTLEQMVGSLLADAEAPFSVHLAALGVLEELVTDGVIVGYDGIQARAKPGDPTHIELRYRYLPAFPLNHITVSFGLNTSAGRVTTELLGV